MPRFSGNANMKSCKRTSISIWPFVILIAAAVEFAAPGQTADERAAVDGGAGAEKLAPYAGTWHTAQQWEQRAKNIAPASCAAPISRPLPARCDLKPVIWSERSRRGYTVENVAFESLPGFFVTGNLYRPAQGSGPFPGILCPHGHVTSGGWRRYTQTRCAVLARMGAVVLAYDMVGMGDSTQTPHTDPNVLTFQLWDSIRALDFLSSLTDVDPARLGCTGESGGGTQTFMLGAVDDRLAVSVPVVMVSAHFSAVANAKADCPFITATGTTRTTPRSPRSLLPNRSA